MARWNKTSAEKVAQIREQFETTQLTYEQIGQLTGTSYHQVINVVHAHYSKEEILARKQKNYRASKLGEKNPYYGLRGKASPHYIGEIGDNKGYLMVLKPDWYTGRKGSKHVFAHHVVVCEHLGLTEIPRGYSVHHCDRDTLNNDFSNLVMLKVSDHSALHHWLNTEGATTISKESTLKWVEARGKGEKFTLDDIV